MLNDYFNRIQSLTLSQINEANLWVENSIGDIELEENTLKTLDGLLSDKNNEELFVYRNSYTRWFSTYGWHLYQSLLFKQTVPLISKCVFIGFLLGENVWNQIVTYLNNRSLDRIDMEEKYTKLREAFLHSQEIIYTDQVTGKNYTVEQFITDSNLPQISDDTLLLSEFFSKFQEKVEQRIIEGDYPVDAFQVTGRLRDLANFFVGIRPERIWYVVDPYFYPQQYTEEALQQSGENQNNVVPSENQEDENTEAFLFDLNTYTKNVLQEEKKKMSYREISEQLTSFVASLPENQKDEQIITRLGELAEQYKDEQIQDLYYFDEKTGKFIWNQELLNEKS